MTWTQRPGDTWRKTARRALARAQTLRHTPTQSESALWKVLRVLKAEGAHFRRQANVGDYVFDFASLSHRLLIELDGGVHNAPNVALRDEAKQNWAEEGGAGYRVLRIKNEELSDMSSVLERVRLALRAPHPLPVPPPLPLPQGGGE